MYTRIILIMSVVAAATGCDSGPGQAELSPDIPGLFSPQNTSVTEATAVYLEWTASERATGYRVQVSTSGSFTDLQIDVDMDGKNVTAPAIPVKDLEVGTTYFWRVRAENEGASSDWSNSFWFKPSTTAKVPDAPSLVSPSNEQINVPQDVSFRWETVPNARFYQIQASQSTDFYNQEANIEGLTGTSQRVSQLIHGYTYYWRVRARNAAGYSVWSPMWYIIIVESE
jgi:Fibronectin type III domain